MKINSSKYNFILKTCFAILISFTLSVNIFSQDVTESNQMAEIQGKIVTQISFVNKSGIIVVPVRINDSRILNMILDSGMSSAVVMLFHKETAEEINLEHSQKVFIGGAGGEGQKTASLSTNAKVNLGNIEMLNQTVLVFEESRASSEWSWDGIIGKSLFDKFVAEIDYENSTVSFYEPADLNINSNNSIPINLDYGFPIVESRLTIGMNEAVPIKLVIDIGHRSALFIKEDSTKNIIPPRITVESVAGRGLQGEVASRIGRIRELSVGNLSVSNIPTSFLSKDANMGIPSTIADGDIGNLVLNRFRLIFDYTRKQMYLIPNKHFGNPFEINMAGLMIEQDIDGIALVRNVIENSPASENGIRKGDKIISINGKSMREYDFYEVQDLFTQEGKELNVTILRNDEEREINLKLRKLI